jgi:putative DNA primase/helicase
MNNLPDFSQFCEAACIKIWGEPDKRTKKELRWTNGDAYGARTYTINKHAWYDHGAERGGSTLELIAYSKGKPDEKLRGRAFIEMWQALHELGVGIDPPPKSKSNGGGGKRQILTTYPYHDEQSVLLSEVVRFDTTDPDERFSQRQPDGKGGWIWNTKGVRKVLYRLPQLIAAVKAGERVLIDEGEKDVNTAVKLGYTATPMPGGVGKWRAEYDEFFRDADVVIVSDNDQQLKDPKTGKPQFHPDGRPVLPGQDHAAKLAKRLSKVAAHVRIVMFPQKDLTDWVVAGGTREQMDALIEQAPEYKTKPEPEPKPEPESGDGGLEDNVALEFSAKYEDNLRYVHLWGKWLFWDGVRWVAEETLRAYHLARVLCRAAEDARHKTVAAVTALARSDPRQAAVTSQWDADTWLLGTPKGTVDLHTGKLSPPKPNDYITKITSVAPSEEPPRDSCPLWLTFLNRITNGDEKLQDYLQRVCGYCLTGSTQEDALFFAYGKGANGKSVLMRTVAGIMNHYHEAASMEMFVVTHGERHPTDLAQLRGARLVTAVETEEGKRWAEAKLKQMTGGDPITARFMRQDPFTYIPQFKLLFAGNHKPAFRTIDAAIMRRMNLIPFTVFIPPEERDLELFNKLKAEWPGILRWMIDGCLAWQHVGLKPPKIVTDATKDYLESQDTTQNFFDDCCVVAKGEFDTFAHLWDGWTDWAEDCREWPGTKKAFGQKLKDKGFQSIEQGKDNTVVYLGIRCIRENAKKLKEEAARKVEEARRNAPSDY